MNWFKENIFASIVLAITLIGTGALVFLCVQEAGVLTESRAAFEEAKGKYTSLIGEPIFPSQENLKKVQAQHALYIEQAKALKDDIVKLEQPLATLKPNEFQDKLNEAVHNVQTAAQEGHVALPAEESKFHLGFASYKSNLPSEVAVPELNLVLDVIKNAVDKAISLHVASIDEVKRVPLSVETGGTAAAAASAAGGKPRPGATAPGQKIVDRSTFTISLTADQRKIQQFLNDMLTTPQLVTVQLVRFENEQVKGPPKTIAPAPGSDVPPSEQTDPNQPPAAQAPPATPAINFILGEEKVKATIRFQIIRLPQAAGAKS